MILWPSRRPNGGGSLFQRFEAYDPPALKGGGGDLMVVGHCFRLVRKDMGASARGRRINLLLALGRSRRLLLHMDFKDGATAIRAKAELRLLGRRGR